MDEQKQASLIEILKASFVFPLDIRDLVKMERDYRVKIHYEYNNDKDYVRVEVNKDIQVILERGQDKLYRIKGYD